MDAYLELLKKSAQNSELVVITGSTLSVETPWKISTEKFLNFLKDSWNVLETYIDEVYDRTITTEALYRLIYKHFQEESFNVFESFRFTETHSSAQNIVNSISKGHIHSFATASIDNLLKLALENSDVQETSLTWLNGHIDDPDSLQENLSIDKYNFSALGETAQQFFSDVLKNDKANTVLVAGLTPEDFCWRALYAEIKKISKTKQVIWLAPETTIALKHLEAVGKVNVVHLTLDEVLQSIDASCSCQEKWQINTKPEQKWLEKNQENLLLLELSAYILNFVVSRFHSFEIYEYLLENYQKQENLEKIAHTYRMMGKILFEQGYIERAIASHTRAIGQWHTSGNHTEMAQEYLHTGDTYWHGSAIDKAVENYTEALSLFKEHNSLKGLSEATSKLALICDTDEDYELAKGYYLESIQIKKILGDLQGVITTLLNLSASLIKNQEWQQSTQYLEEALKLCEEHPRLFGEEEVLQHLGLVYMNLQNFAQARIYYERVYNSYESKQDQLSQTFVYCNLGHVCARLEDYDAAIKYYEGALENYEKMGDWQHLAAVYNNLGFINTNREEYSHAEEYFSRAAEIFAALGDVYNLIRTHSNLARIYTTQNEIENAIECYRANIEMLSQLGEREDLASTSISLALVQLQSKQFEDAITNLQEAVDIYASLGLTKEKEDTLKILTTVEAKIASR